MQHKVGLYYLLIKFDGRHKSRFLNYLQLSQGLLVLDGQYVGGRI